MLKLENISFSYQNNHLLESINLSISVGEFTCLIGPNGIGKSTLLKLIMGELKPAKGKIHFDSVILHFYKNNIFHTLTIK